MQLPIIYSNGVQLQIINARRACAREIIIVLILFVCVLFSSSIRRLCRILNMEIGFTLHLDFQLTDFAEKPSFVSYTNSDFSQYTAAILAIYM